MGYDRKRKTKAKHKKSFDSDKVERKIKHKQKVSSKTIKNYQS